MTCTDCYLYKNCVLRPYMQKKNTVEKDCGYFKDKEKIIELPCKVGDEIYRVGTIFGGRILGGWNIVRAEIYADEIGFVDDSDNYFTDADIGKTVFLSRAEAEIAARKEQGK